MENDKTRCTRLAASGEWASQQTLRLNCSSCSSNDIPHLMVFCINCDCSKSRVPSLMQCVYPVFTLHLVIDYLVGVQHLYFNEGRHPWPLCDHLERTVCGYAFIYIYIIQMLCVCVCVRVSVKYRRPNGWTDHDQIWHVYADRPENGSYQKKMVPRVARKGGLIGAILRSGT